jgi:hypothetical protein
MLSDVYIVVALILISNNIDIDACGANTNIYMIWFAFSGVDTILHLSIQVFPRVSSAPREIQPFVPTSLWNHSEDKFIVFH